MKWQCPKCLSFAEVSYEQLSIIGNPICSCDTEMGLIDSDPIDLLRNLFEDADESGCLWEVWKLVSALRGPDDGDTELKAKYTSRIRNIFLTPSQALHVGLDAHGFNCDRRVDSLPFHSDEFIENYDHYLNHIRMAAEVIERYPR